MKVSVLEEVELSFRAGNRRAAFVSLPFGALLPLATYHQTLSVSETEPFFAQWATYLAAGGLIYSGLTIYRWLHSMLVYGETTKWGRFGAAAKAAGFVVLTEGTLAHPPNWWMGIVMVGMLMVVNAISLQARAVLTKAETRAERRRVRAPKPQKPAPVAVSAKNAATRHAEGKKSVQKVAKSGVTRLRKTA